MSVTDSRPKAPLLGIGEAPELPDDEWVESGEDGVERATPGYYQPGDLEGGLREASRSAVQSRRSGLEGLNGCART